MHVELPVELWITIFRLAADDEVLYANSNPTTAWHTSNWFKLTVSGVTKWTLRSPQDEVALLQHRRTRQMKAIVSTCKYWRHIGIEFLYSCLYFELPSNIIRICGALDRDRHLGRLVRRLHITRYFSREGLSTDDLELGLVSVLQHCRKLETFIIEWPVNTAFTAIADALCTYSSRSLRTLHVHVPPTELAKLIWTLDSLQNLVSLHLEIGERMTEDTRLGSAGNVSLTFPELAELSLTGDSCDFIEQAVDWEFPQLRSFTFDFGAHRHDLPDIVEFLANHGSALTYLDINCMLPFDIPTILEQCPLLTSFSFNPDCRLGDDQALPSEASKIVKAPHPNLTHIGLHQLLHAFGVGYAGAYARVDPLIARYVRHSNDLNFAALTKRNFPKLTHIRLLNRTLLRDLEAANGPAEICYERWERWSSQCGRERVRLEDCTGSELGHLPELDEDDDDEDDNDDAVSDDSYLPAGDPVEQVQYLTRQIRRLTTALQYGPLVANTNAY